MDVWSQSDESSRDVDDVIDMGREGPAWWRHLLVRVRAVSRSVRWTAAILAVMSLAMVAYAFGAFPTPDREVRASPTTAAAPSATTDRPDDDFAIVRALATGSGTRGDTVRAGAPSGGCPTIRIGSSPGAAITQVVQHAFPHFEADTVARVLDQTTGLCAVDVRLQGPRSVTLVIRVAAPSATGRHPRARTVSGASAAALRPGSIPWTTAFARTTTASGWTILAGTFGPSSAELPTVSQLTTLTSSPSLLW